MTRKWTCNEHHALETVRDLPQYSTATGCRQCRPATLSFRREAFLVNIDVCDGSSHDIGIAMDVATAASCHATHIGDRDRVCFCANPENESSHQLLACW